MPTDFKKKQKSNPSKKIAIIFFGFLILAVAIFLVVANVKTYKKKKELNAQIESLQSKIAEMKTKNENLQQGISNADDPKYIEKVAREELDLQKPGENVVSFVMPENQDQSPAPAPKSFWQNWLGWISGLFSK